MASGHSHFDALSHLTSYCSLDGMQVKGEPAQSVELAQPTHGNWLFRLLGIQLVSWLDFTSVLVKRGAAGAVRGACAAKHGFLGPPFRAHGCRFASSDDSVFETQVKGEPQVQYVELAQPEHGIELPKSEEQLLSTHRCGTVQLHSNAYPAVAGGASSTPPLMTTRKGRRYLLLV